MTKYLMYLAKSIVIIVCLVGAYNIAYVAKILFFPVIYPTSSTPRKLSIVLYDSYPYNTLTITLRHYVDNWHIRDYVLEVGNVRIEEPQLYDLPLLNKGSVDVVVELGDEEAGILKTWVFPLAFSQARELYDGGLLIYLTTHGSELHSEMRWSEELSSYCSEHFYDRYIHFVYRKEMKTFFKEAYSEGWSLYTTETPPLKRLPRKYDGPKMHPYLVAYWKDNDWVAIDVNKPIMAQEEK